MRVNRCSMKRLNCLLLLALLPGNGVVGSDTVGWDAMNELKGALFSSLVFCFLSCFFFSWGGG